MDKKAVALLAAVVVLLLWWALARTPATPTTGLAPEPLTPTEAPRRTAPAAATKSMQAPAPTADHRAKPCRDYLTQVMALDLSAFGYATPHQRLSPEQLGEFAHALSGGSLKNGCPDLKPSDPIAAMNSEYWRTCGEIGKKAEEQQWDDVHGCLDKLYVLRLQALADAYAALPARDFDDPAVLGLVLMGTPWRDPAAWPERYVALAKRKAELEPTNPEGAYGVVQGLYAKTIPDRLGGKPKPIDPIVAEELLAAADHLDQLSPGDSRVLETRVLVARTRGDTEEMVRLANEQVARGENIPEATFALAQADYLAGNRDQARARLEKLKQMDPNNPRWAASLSALDHAPKGAPLEVLFPDRLSHFGF